MEEFKKLFKESLPYFSRYYLGLVYFGEESFEEGYYGLWEEEGTQTFQVKIEDEEKEVILKYIEEQGFQVTDDWSYFSEFCSLVHDDNSLGLIAREIDNGKAPFLILLKMLQEVPRFHFKGNKEAVNEEEFFYNFGDELQFCKGTRKKLRYLRRWLRKKKYITTRVNGEKVFLMMEVGDNGIIFPKDVQRFFNLYHQI